jgi:hypothetical protein
MCEVEIAIATLFENDAPHKVARDAGMTFSARTSPALRSGFWLGKMTQWPESLSRLKSKKNLK